MLEGKRDPYYLLRHRIKVMYGKQSAFAKAIGLSERSVSLKLNGIRKWKVSEALKIMELLNISPKELDKYFLASEQHGPVLTHK